ncbi:MAG TPA: PmoA family protein [Bryobacteraceae bacterium]|jgi:hypothetical protein|nr:PmoA family protein [Bryobacteraceae bacterium]
MRFQVLAFLVVAPLTAQVAFNVQSGTVEVDVNGQTFTVLYYQGINQNKPYFHPLRLPDGTNLTRSYPMEQVKGEKTDHPHHRGLWFTHGDVNGLDFWMNEYKDPRPNKGIIALAKPVRVQGGKKQGTLDAEYIWKDPKGEPLLEETRKVTFYTDPQNRVMDFDVTLKAIQKVKFGDTKEGTFAVRVATEIAEEGGGKMVNASGATGEKEVWGKPSPWVDYVGEIKGKKVGIALMDHPSNPKHPTYWHCRAYGLCAANIFGEHDFFNDKKRDGSITLEPGKTMHFRYRVVAHPGDTESAGIARIYEDFKTKK